MSKLLKGFLTLVLVAAVNGLTAGAALADEPTTPVPSVIASLLGPGVCC